MTSGQTPPTSTEAEIEVAIADLSPRGQELVKACLADYPTLSVERCIEELKYFGGL